MSPKKKASTPAPKKKGDSSRSRSATPAKGNGDPQATLHSFFTPSPSPGPSGATKEGSLKRKASNASLKSEKSGDVKGKGKAKASTPTVIDLCDSPPSSPKLRQQKKSTVPPLGPSATDDGDVFAVPFALPRNEASNDAVPQEGDDYIRPPELGDGDEDDDAWEVETVGSETLCGRSVAGDREPIELDADEEDGDGLGVCETAVGSGHGEGPPRCPICDTKLSGMVITDAQRHVNTCLDQLTGGSGAASSSSSTSKPAKKQKTRHESPSSRSSSVQPVAGPSKASSSSALKPLQPLSALSKAFINTSPSPATGSSLTITSKNPDAFTALMQGHAEDKAWKRAEKDHQKSRLPGGARFQGKREAPFYKIMDGMPLAVDAFRYGAIPGVKAYFLSHAHADHYTNLSGSWTHGPIHCSVTTGNLIMHNLGVKREWVRSIPNDTPTVVEGVTVTVLDANHCPGSSLFLFEGPHTAPSSPYSKTPDRIFRYLHCGDFRASPVHLRHPAMAGKKMDIVYLDTTYLNPKYCFPAQEQVINACADLVKERLEGDKGALRRGRGGDGSMERAEKMMAGWLETGPKKEDPDEKPGASFFAPKAEVKDEVKAEEVPEVEEESQSSTTTGVKDEPEDEDEKMMWEALEVEAGAEAGADEHPDDEKPDLKSSTLDTKPLLSRKPSNGEERFCILIGTYSIGKERIVKAIAKRIGSKIYANEHKSAIFRCIDDPDLHALMTNDPLDACVHVTNLFAIKKETLEDYLDRFQGRFTKIIGLRPTGWTFKAEGKEDKMPSIAKTLALDSKRGFSPAYLYPQRDSTERCQAYGVPYSEHSSFFELTCFCISFDWVRIIPTVNCGNPTSRAKMKAWFDRWQAERKRRKEAREPLFIEPRNDKYW